MKCHKCGCTEMHEQIMPDGYIHYSKIICVHCRTFIKWGKRPAVQNNKNTEGQKMNINSVIVVGRLTKDPELRYTPTGNKAVTQFSIAVDKYSSGEQQQANFFSVVAWEKTAEFITKYFFKGKKIIIKGELNQRSWQKEGATHSITEIVAREVDFADDKKKEGSASSSQQQSSQQQSSQQRYQDKDAGFYPEYNEDQLPF